MRHALLVSLILAGCGGDDAAAPDAMPAPQGTPIFLNRAGGDYTMGTNDSSTNTSSILPAAHTFGALTITEPRWDTLLACLRDRFAPFDVSIVDEDPGDVVHVEALMVAAADWPSVIAQDTVSGLAPYDCTGFDRPIVFMNVDFLGADDVALCEITAQLIANTKTVDHANYCPDLMSFQTDCGPKTFVDMDVPCGELTDRACTCGGDTQNSYQLLLAAFGAAP